MREAAYM